MDGHFVPNITLGPNVVKSLRKDVNMVFDAHLMIENPDQYIKEFVDAGCDIIVVHQEACRHLHRTIQNIKSYGIKAGAVSYTHLDVYKRQNKYYLDYVINKLSKIKTQKLSICVKILLRMGIYQIAFLNSISDYAAVNETVNLVKKYDKRSSGFVNAILRNIIRNKDEILNVCLLYTSRCV